MRGRVAPLLLASLTGLRTGMGGFGFSGVGPGEAGELVLVGAHVAVQVNHYLLLLGRGILWRDITKAAAGRSRRWPL